VVIKSRELEYQHENANLKAYMAWDDSTQEQRPMVLSCHDAMGANSDFQHGRAKALAKLGYVGFALDVYGDGKHANNAQEAYQQMEPFISDREFLRRRLLSAIEAASDLPEVDEKKIAAIGYCFGGLCALDLARSGAPLKGIVSFHGTLSASDTVAAKPVSSKILVQHGWSDPLVPIDQVIEFTAEMNALKADWEFVGYGGTMHSFTNPDANNPEIGIAYSKTADHRSWLRMSSFLTEVFV